ncbi:MAG TPA: 50S ribosomal protein L2 [Anaerohalosphaeraceae bacterium]|jgi:large subunit ribosomal protein L2|nr:50S ribosomal protein L2 [Anaerohalosphaeraceae bacterium]HPB92006.1 50S ribosomal protein L2 [Anaerohalosphaeraceae bacterium]HRT22742.1 50S ribosomal protein L2 [Anaerohalosphaeraceae bacterium]HRU14220.1 50S ribosomal protein L2 [Anaerohalosphaeraceae bacterium]
MAIRVYKPTSPGRRNASVIDYKKELTAFRPEKSLCRRIRKSGGRNHTGETTVRFRGGGSRRIYRIIDFKRNKDNTPAKVLTIEYDPNRNCFISLVQYEDGEKRYILAPQGIQVGQTVESGPSVEPKLGNAMPLESIPVGVEIHNIEMEAGQGGKLARTAGSSARLMAKEGDWATIVLPSGEMRMVRKECRATIGQLSNSDYQNVKIGKAGRKRHKGFRSHVRGKAMNPVAHPLGGGEGRANGGRHPCSPTGVLAKGGKTRNPRKVSSRRIIRRRKNNRGIQLVL